MAAKETKQAAAQDSAALAELDRILADFEAPTITGYLRVLFRDHLQSAPAHDPLEIWDILEGLGRVVTARAKETGRQ